MSLFEVKEVSKNKVSLKVIANHVVDVLNNPFIRMDYDSIVVDFKGSVPCLVTVFCMNGDSFSIDCNDKNAYIGIKAKKLCDSVFEFIKDNVILN